jgi:SAM-dependent methyltransferase
MNKNQPTRGKGLLEEFLAKKRAEKASSLIPETCRKGKILDIGCGSYPYFLSVINFKDKYGIDPALKYNGNNKLTLLKQDVAQNKLPYGDNYFDILTMLAVFEHIEYQKLNFVLSEIKRVLKNKGKVIITTPAPWADKILHIMGNVNLISSVEIHDHKHHYSKTAIVEIIKKAGFKNVKCGYFEAFMNMWFVAEK